MIRFAGITEIFRLIFRQCGSFSLQSFSPQLSRSASASCSLGWTMAAPDWRNSNNGFQSQVQTDGFSHSFTQPSLIHAVSTCLHEAWQRPSIRRFTATLLPALIKPFTAPCLQDILDHPHYAVPVEGGCKRIP